MNAVLDSTDHETVRDEEKWSFWVSLFVLNFPPVPLTC